MGEQILDLEGLANHRGSSYGALGLPAQPSPEQFENLLALNWTALAADRPVWIEAESRMVGTCRVPNELFIQMLQAPVWQIQRSRQERVALLLEEYGNANRKDLIVATERLQKRIGQQRVKQAVDWIETGNLAPAIELVLDYYDKTYQYDLHRRKGVNRSIDGEGRSPRAIALQLLTQHFMYPNC